MGVTGDSATDIKEDKVVFEAGVEPLVENDIEEAKKVDRFEKELASTLDDKYWAVADGRTSHRRRK